MGYYTIRLDTDAQKICATVLPWDKYLYLCLPIGISSAPDSFQEKMSNLMRSLEYVLTYIDALLIITMGKLNKYLTCFEVVLKHLKKAKLRVNTRKSNFAQDKVDYLGYVLSREGIKTQPKKASAILSLKEPNNVKSLWRFLGMVQYYRGVWKRRSHMISPLTDLIGL